MYVQVRAGFSIHFVRIKMPGVFPRLKHGTLEIEGF